MNSETKFKILMWASIFSLFLFPITLSEILGDIIWAIFLFIWYIGFIWLFLLKSKTGMSLMIRFDDWLHLITGGNWQCDNCMAKYNWKERQPILSYMIQQRVDYYTEPLSLRMCHKHFVNSDMIKSVKSEIEEGIKGQYNIQWSRDGTHIPDWFNTVKEATA